LLVIGTDMKAFATTTASPTISINQIVTVDGTQTLAVYGFASTGTLTISRQVLSLVKLYS
jgi:hypothetical protein